MLHSLGIKVYGGKQEGDGTALINVVVMDFVQPYLDFGRILTTENFYTSIDLAHLLNQRDIHLVGTLHSNRKKLPKTLLKKKLKKSYANIILSKRKYKRDILMLSAVDPPEIVKVIKRDKIVLKPKIVLTYNKGK